MKFIEGKITDNLQTNVIYAKDQPQYNQLPAYRNQYGILGMAVELTDEEVEQIVKNRKIYLSLMTFNKPLQPIYITTKPKNLDENIKYYTESIDAEVHKYPLRG